MIASFHGKRAPRALGSTQAERVVVGAAGTCSGPFAARADAGGLLARAPRRRWRCGG